MISLSTGSLHNYGLARVFALASRAGFDCLEVLIDERWDTRQADYLQQLSVDYRIPITSLHNPFVPRIPGWPDEPVARLLRTIQLARQLNIDTVVVHLPLRIGYVVFRGFNRIFLLPTVPSPYTKMRRWMEREMSGVEASNNLKLCVENMPARRLFRMRFNPCWWNNLQEWPRFSHLTLDTTHLGTWGLNPLDVYRRIKGQVSHIHLSNFSEQEHRRLEDGHLPLAPFLAELRQDQYPGNVVVELAPDALEAHDDNKVRDHLEKQLAFCRQHFA